VREIGGQENSAGNTKLLELQSDCALTHWRRRVCGSGTPRHFSQSNFILRLEEELEKENIYIMIVLFLVVVSKYVTRNMKNCIFEIYNNAMDE
jgi:hypothetical protein